MKLKKLYRFPFASVSVGQGVLLVIIIATGNLGPLALKANLSPVLLALLIIAIGTTIFSLMMFIKKFTYNPNRLKLNVLIAIAFLAITLVFLLLNFTYSNQDYTIASEMTKDYLIDAGTVSFLVMAYHFVLFGFDVLISPSIEIRLNVSKLIMDIIFLVAYFMNFGATIAELLARPVIKTWLNETGDAIAYVLYLVCAFFLVLMVSKSIALQRKATDTRSKAGFRSWAITFFLIIVDIFLILLFTLLAEISGHEADLGIIFGVGLIIVTITCSYFIYKGFIAPASVRPS